MDREGEQVNSLGRRFTEELGEIVKWVEEAAKTGEVKGLVLISAKPTGFLVGADIREFERFDTEPHIKEVVKETLALFDRLEKLCPCPSSPPSTAIASAADLNWRLPATGASPTARTTRGSASPR